VHFQVTVPVNGARADSNKVAFTYQVVAP
jgi:hypothetical protein